MSKKAIVSMPDLFGQETFVNINALTWKPPFLSLMAYEEKIETRTWSCKPAGKILMCNGLTGYTDKQLENLCTPEQIEFLKEYEKNDPFKNMKGYAVATGVFVKCRRMRKEDEAKAFVKYNPNLWCHVYNDVKLIESFPFKGNQRWTVVSDQKILSSIKHL